MFLLVGVIYKITNLVNGKAYVGQTIQELKTRWSDHCKIGKTRKPTPIKNAIRKWGEENFKIEELYVAFDVRALDLAEIQLIEAFNSISPNGYNLYSGGNKNRQVHLETKLKRSISSTKHKIVAFQIRTGTRLEFRNIIDAEQKTGVDFRNIYAQCTGKQYSKSFGGYMWFFRENEPENPTYVNKALPKPVLATHLTTGEQLRFASTKRAETDGGFMRKSVSLACRGIKKTYRGYVWRYTI